MPCKHKSKELRLAILMSSKSRLQNKKITRDKEGCNDKGSVYQEDIAILNICKSNNRAAKYIK